jgi:hypothetical protein
VRDFVGGKICLIEQGQSLKLSHLFIVVETVGQVVCVENNQRHAEVTVISYLSYLVDLVNFFLHMIKLRVLELRDGEEVGRLLHGGF